MSEVRGTFAVVQLNRLGDLIQAHQTVKDLKLQHPNVVVKLIAREEFYRPLKFLLDSSFDQVITLDKKTLISESNNQLQPYLDELSKWLEQDELKGIDVVINQSFCQTSNYLTTLINSKHKLGTHVGYHNQVMVSDQWSQLIYSMVMGGPDCPFHLVDIYKNQFGIKERHNWEHAERHIGEKQTVALHPFASQEKKRWKPQKWSEVLFKLLKESPDIKVKIFGSTSEKSLVEQIVKTPSLKRYLDRIENNVGKLNLNEVYNKLQECSFFVGHDSALGHLAKEVGLPSLTISLGTVRPTETAPYGNNTFVLAPKTKCFPCFPDTECNFFQCHADLSYQAVTEVIRSFVVEEDIDFSKLKQKVSPFHLDSLSLFRFGPSNTGWFAAENIGDGQATLNEAFRDILKVALSYKMEEIEENLSLPKISAQVEAQLKHLNEGVEQLYQLCEFGKKYSKDVIVEISTDNPSIEKIKNLGDKVQEVDQLMDLLPKAYPLLRQIVDFYKVMKSNLYGENIVDISESSYLVYNDNAVLCSLLYELTGNIIKTTESGSSKKSYTKEGNA